MNELVYAELEIKRFARFSNKLLHQLCKIKMQNYILCAVLRIIGTFEEMCVLNIFMPTLKFYDGCASLKIDEPRMNVPRIIMPLMFIEHILQYIQIYIRNS